MRTVLRRATHLVAAVSLAMTGLLALGTTEAQAAYNCNHGEGSWVYGPGAKVDIFVYWGCSDNRDHWNGTVYDTKCDAHAGHVEVAADLSIDPTVDGFDSSHAQWVWSATAGNGCGTWTTFSGSDPSALDEITVGTANCNWWELNCNWGLLKIPV
ncbi:MAG TPA: hypothetical protein VFI65_29955 [Streptosporangiaceae bacterium]|nr:hypothetical protein [Streptosporangiaceae bacterium]